MARSEGSSGSPRRDAWRGQGGRRPPAPRPSREGDRWKRRLPSDADLHFAGEQRRLLVRRLGTTAAAIGLVVALVYLASGFKRQVPLITGVVAEYRPPLGPPAAAEEDRLLLTDPASDRSWFNRSTARPIDVSPVLREADRDQFLEGCGNALAKVSGGGPGNDTAILYVAAIGAVDRHGHACLVPPRTPVGRIADSDAGWLSVDALLDRLDSVRQRPARLLVVLDACRAAHGEPLGILDGSFAAAVAADVRAKPRSGLWVLVSAAPGQTACVHATEGGSVFAIAFHEALQGRADAAPWGDADGRVELRELASYLGDEVDRRAIIHHGRHQTPFVVPPPPDAAADVPLAWTASRDGRVSVARETPARDQERSDWFAARWKRAEEIRPRGVTERPRGWAEYERLLLRAERLAGSGAAGREELKAVKAAVEAAEKTLGEPLVAAESLPGLRLTALVREISGAAHPEWVAGLEDWSQEVAGAAAPATAVVALPPCRDADEWLLRAELAWSKMVGLVRSGAVVDAEAWRRWETLVGDPPAAVGVRPVELHAARLLGRWGDGSAWRSAAGTFSRIAILEQDAAAAAFADDVRADALAGALVPRQTADRSRRMAFDLAIVGDETAVTKAAEQARQAAAGYEASALVGRDVAAAWRTADDVRAELPWLAAWRAMERGTAADVRGDAEVDVSAIVSGVAKLEKLLTAPAMTAAPGVIDELRAVHVQVAREFDAVRDAFDETCGRLADRSADDASTLAAVRAVLATPLVTGARRARLLERESALAILMAGRPVEAAAAAVQPVDPDPAAARAHWAPWKGGFVDPFVAAIVGESAPAVAKPASNGDIALAAGAWGQLVRAEAAAALEPAVEGGLPANAVAERRRAVVAPLQDGDATAAASPATGQMLACWRDRLGTAARDAIDDFFAGVERDDTVWFTAAADACLRSAERIEPPVAGDPLEKTRVRLDALATLSQGWAGLSSVPDRLGAAGDQASSLVRSVLRIEPSVADFVPQGDAAVWLLDADESLWLRGQGSDAAVRRVVLPVGRPDATGQPRAADWRVDRTSAAVLAAREGGTLDLTAWFRGHRFVTALPISSGGGAVPIVWRPAKHLPPRITVRGADDRRGFVSFIFDCSISMEKRTPGGRPRFDVGREAFAEVLKAMADARTWDASVWLYGHRTKWGKEPPHPPGLSRAGMRQQQAAINAGRPFDLQPGEDVEQVLPMQPLGPGQARSLDGILGELEPAGETPLYLAMRRTLAADMTLVPRGEAWRVIAVTDGVNFQLRPPYTTKADVLQTLTEVNRGRAKPVPIDVIALDLKPKPDEVAAFTEMQQLVKDSGGQFRDAADIEKLKQAFREFLSLSRWEAAAPQAAAQQAEVGGSLEIEGVDPVAPRALDVRIEGKPATTAQVVVAGGEGLELFAAADGRPLEHRRYDGGTEQGIRDQHDDLPDPRDPRARWFVAGHLPRREGGRTVRFPISIQNGDERKFSPRPVDLWAEVRPEGIAGVQPFVFVDLEFEPHRPVPVIDLVVPDWPEGAEAARIGVWFATQPVEPAAIVLLGELVPGETRTVKDPKLPGVAIDVTLERLAADRGRVTVVEQHAADVRDLPRLRVRVEPTCERAEHAVELGSGSVRHVFDIALAEGKVAAGTKLTVIDRDRLKEQAVGPKAPGGRLEPLRVPVPRE